YSAPAPAGATAGSLCAQMRALRFRLAPREGSGDIAASIYGLLRRSCIGLMAAHGGLFLTRRRHTPSANSSALTELGCPSSHLSTSTACLASASSLRTHQSASRRTLADTPVHLWRRRSLVNPPVTEDPRMTLSLCPDSTRRDSTLRDS